MSGAAYIRFVCFHTVERQRNRLGVFQAIELATEHADAPAWALNQLAELDSWFTARLDRPSRFTSSRARFHKGGYVEDGQTGLSWFKPNAVEHISRMHELKTALQACDVHVDVLVTRDPGKIVWEDEHQVIAEPGHRRF